MSSLTCGARAHTCHQVRPATSCSRLQAAWHRRLCRRTPPKAAQSRTDDESVPLNR